jgi:hypothetical protein
VLNRHAFQIDSFEATNVDGSHPIALGVGAFSVGVNAARLAEAVLDNVLVESVRGDLFFGRKHT